jgi:hypothetical protein
MHCGWKCRYAPLCLGTELGSDLKEIIDASYTVSEKANWLGDDEEGE